MLLKQSKGPDRPHRGQCMAVVLLQPQVGWDLLCLPAARQTAAEPFYDGRSWRAFLHC
jgi:hypothetical protein